MSKQSHFVKIGGAALLLTTIFLSLRPAPAPAWGFFGHRKINRQAVFTLPPELISFYKRNIQFITEHSVDPDKRRYASPFEASRHYMDLDRYGEAPFTDLPRNWTDALMQHTHYFFVNEKSDTLSLLAGPVTETTDSVLFHPALGGDTLLWVSRQAFRRFFIQNIQSKYYEPPWTVATDSLTKLLKNNNLHCHEIFAEDHFSEHGIVPYHLQTMLALLTKAFRERDGKKILRYSADFGHYIADAHVPLHTTQNYNGQLTGQDGIHAFWESRVPELLADETYDFWVGKADLIEDPETYFWDIVLKSHTYVDSVLGIEQALRAEFPPDRQMCSELRGESLVRTQCEEFTRAYSRRMRGMVEDRMRSSIQAVGSAWYTAWVLAGQPDLSTLDPAPVADADSTDAPVNHAVPQGRAHE